MIHIKAIKEKETAIKIWRNYQEIAWKLYEYPEEIWSDQETVFISKVWKEKCQKQEMKHPKTISYHSQINEQMKWINQEIKKYLRKYISHHQDNWKELLSMLEYTYNIRRMETQIYSPYQIIYGEILEVIAKKIMKEVQTHEWQYDETIWKKEGNPAP